MTSGGGFLTHAGGVVFRKHDQKLLYLVVSSSDGANWAGPKRRRRNRTSFGESRSDLTAEIISGSRK